MCADVIFAAENAQFGLPETRHGIIGECGVVHRAVRQLPQRVAMAMILTGERIDAGTALRHGLVNEVVPTGNLETAADGWAEKINKCAPPANHAAKAAAPCRAGARNRGESGQSVSERVDDVVRRSITKKQEQELQ